jgi:hypothetical protein
MTTLADERGGVLAKLLLWIVVLAVLAGGALYIYGTHQQPLELGPSVHVASSDGDTQPSTVTVTPGAIVSVATFVYNRGRLPITLEGLGADAPHDAPLVPVELRLGDGTSTAPAKTAVFTKKALDPGSGIGVLIVYGVNPDLACNRYGDQPGEPTSLPPVTLRFSSYGIDTTQSIELGRGAPTVAGLTRTQCEAATPA